MMLIAPADCRVLLGTVLRGTAARYFLQEVIGEGGQGWVFRASYDDAEGFPVVVKVLRPDTVTRDALDRFRREAEILKRLSQTTPSPFIVRFYDHGEAEFPLPIADSGAVAQLPFTVLEYVHGEPLYNVIQRQAGQGQPIKRVRRILREVNKALEIVHAQGLIHRDLKPSNILISNEAGREVAKVTDFGLVKQVDVRATSTQSLAGVSLSYAPPEQYEPGNPRVGPWTDVFSFAAIVHELLCGREAYPANRSNPFEALRLIASSRRERLAQKAQGLSPGLESRPDVVQRIDALLDRLLAPEPRDRPQQLGPAFEAVDALLREVENVRPSDVSGGFASAQTRPGHGGAPDAISPPAPQVAYAPVASPYASPAISMPLVAPNAAAPNVMAPNVVARDASDLRAWTFRVLSAATPGAHVRDVVFADDLRDLLTLGNAGLVSWTPSGWSSVPLAIGMTPAELRGLARVGANAHVLCGDQGLVAFLHAYALWDVRRYPDVDFVFHAVAADPTGQRVLAVGQRASRGHAVVVEAVSSGWRRTFEVPDQAPLRAVAWLDDRTAFACGDAGSLVRVDEAGLTRIPWERSGHLRAITAAASQRPQVFAVGTGGHALAVPLHPSAGVMIEKVGTTQDLLGVAIAPDGAAWACSANGRVLRRDATGAWRRFPQDLPSAGNLLRIAPRAQRTIVVAEDATVLEATFG